MAFSPTNPPKLPQCSFAQGKENWYMENSCCETRVPRTAEGGLYRCVQVVDICSKNRKGGMVFKVAGQ